MLLNLLLFTWHPTNWAHIFKILFIEHIVLFLVTLSFACPPPTFGGSIPPCCTTDCDVRCQLKYHYRARLRLLSAYTYHTQSINVIVHLFANPNQVFSLWCRFRSYTNYHWWQLACVWKRLLWWIVFHSTPHTIWPFSIRSVIFWTTPGIHFHQH